MYDGGGVETSSFDPVTSIGRTATTDEEQLVYFGQCGWDGYLWRGTERRRLQA